MISSIVLVVLTLGGLLLLVQPITSLRTTTTNSNDEDIIPGNNLRHRYYHGRRSLSYSSSLSTMIHRSSGDDRRTTTTTTSSSTIPKKTSLRDVVRNLHDMDGTTAPANHPFLFLVGEINNNNNKCTTVCTRQQQQQQQNDRSLTTTSTRSKSATTAAKIVPRGSSGNNFNNPNIIIEGEGRDLQGIGTLLSCILTFVGFVIGDIIGIVIYTIIGTLTFVGAIPIAIVTCLIQPRLCGNAIQVTITFLLVIITSLITLQLNVIRGITSCAVLSSNITRVAPIPTDYIQKVLVSEYNNLAKRRKLSVNKTTTTKTKKEQSKTKTTTTTSTTTKSNNSTKTNETTTPTNDDDFITWYESFLLNNTLQTTLFTTNELNNIITSNTSNNQGKKPSTASSDPFYDIANKYLQQTLIDMTLRQFTQTIPNQGSFPSLYNTQGTTSLLPLQLLSASSSSSSSESSSSPSASSSALSNAEYLALWETLLNQLPYQKDVGMDTPLDFDFSNDDLDEMTQLASLYSNTAATGGGTIDTTVGGSDGHDRTLSEAATTECMVEEFLSCTTGKALDHIVFVTNNNRG